MSVTLRPLSEIEVRQYPCLFVTNFALCLTINAMISRFPFFQIKNTAIQIIVFNLLNLIINLDIAKNKVYYTINSTYFSLIYRSFKKRMSF